MDNISIEFQASSEFETEWKNYKVNNLKEFHKVKKEALKECLLFISFVTIYINGIKFEHDYILNDEELRYFDNLEKFVKILFED